MIAVLLLTCGRADYTKRTLESFTAQHPHAREQFLLLHGDDGSQEPDNLALAAAHGFATVVHHPTQRGARALRTAMVQVAVDRHADWTMLLENDWEWVRPFPVETFEYVRRTRPDVYSLRLYGQYKERGQKCPCSLRNHGVPSRSAAPWRRLAGAPEAVDVGRYHWGAPPAVTRTSALLRIHQLVRGRTDRGDHSEMVASGRIDGFVARVLENCVFHIGQSQTRAIAPRHPAPPKPSRPIRTHRRPALYTPQWQETRRWTLPGSSACLDAALVALGQPVGLLDVGCGEGHFVTRAQARGIRSVGVDVSIPVTQIDTPIRHADLTVPLDVQEQFGLVLCWEVAEHLPAAAADVLCDTLVRHVRPGGVLLFTAATPGQGGQGHLNEQPHEYWRERLIARGLGFDSVLTQQLSARFLAAAPKQSWYGRNVQVFRAAGEGAFLPAPGLRLAITMRTADRSPKPNYLGGTVRRLLAQGIPPSELQICLTDPDTRWLSGQLGASIGSVTLHVPSRQRTPNENGLAQIASLDPNVYDWVLLLEDDLSFCADFVASVKRWIGAAARPNRHLYRLFGFRVSPPHGHVGFYDDRLDRCAGSQAVLLRMEDAQDFLVWSRANLETWGGFRGNAKIAFDKLLASWVLARFGREPGVMSHPMFVKHIGKVSSLHPSTTQMDRFFAGDTWSYPQVSA